MVTLGCGSEQPAPPSLSTSSTDAGLQYSIDGEAHAIETVDAVFVSGSQPSIMLSGTHASDAGVGTTLSLKIFQFDGTGAYPVEVVNGGLVASITVQRVGGSYVMVNTQATPSSGALIEVTAYDAEADRISGRFSGTVSDGTHTWSITDGTFKDLALRTM